MTNLNDYMQHPVEFDGGASDYQVLCPVCGFEYVDFGAPQQLDGNDAYDAVPDGWVRGNVIEIPMSCESGHEWKLQVGFHKGYTLMRSVRLPDDEHTDAAFYDEHHAEWELDEYLATHDVFALDVDTRLDAQGLATTMQSLRDTPPRAVVRILAKRGWDWSFIARCMRTTPDAPDIWAEVTWEDVAAIFGGADYPTHI